jgi:hypothetical protein
MLCIWWKSSGNVTAGPPHCTTSRSLSNQAREDQSSRCDVYKVVALSRFVLACVQSPLNLLARGGLHDLHDILL